MGHRRLFATAAGLLVASILAAGCAEEIGDIDRTQANRIKKSDLLDHEWYFAQTVMKAPATSGYTFQMDGGELERVRFKIDEKYLLVYRSYEFLPNTDKHQDQEDYTGELLAAYRIESHFDIQRQYNPTTGEESNVIVENTTDRQWWEREYMRVDWSENLAPNIDPKYEWFTWHVFNISHVAPVSYYVQDTPDAWDDPDRAEFRDGWISFVNRYALHFDLDECLNSVYFQLSCGPVEVKVRNVFKRIDGDDDYQPKEYRDIVPLTWDDGSPLMVDFSTSRGGVIACPHGTHPYDKENYCSQESVPLFERFGFFRTGSIFGGRPEWDDRRGMTWENRHDRIVRHNIWKKWLDEDGNLIPVQEREPKPIEFTLAYDYPEDLKGSVREVIDEWNEVFMRLLRELHHPKADEPGFRMVTLRDNNCTPKGLGAFLDAHPIMQKVVDRVLEGEETKDLEELSLHDRARVCSALEYETRTWPEGSRFTWAKQGDLGRNMLNVVIDPQVAGPLGIATLWYDPVTGEMIHQAATVYLDALQVYISYAADVVDVLNGKLALEDLIYGVNVREEVRARRGEGASRQKAGELPEVSSQDVLHQYLGQMQERMDRDIDRPLDPRVLQEINDRFSRLGHTTEEIMGESPAGFRDAMLEKIRGTELERRLITDEMIMMFNPGWKPGDPITDEMYERASPLTWLFGRGREERVERIRRAERYNVMLADFVEDQIIGLALELKDLSREELYQYLYHLVFKAVLLHEVGHGFGLRHNFEGSFDALNYQDEYWQIRSRLEAQAQEEGWTEAELERAKQEARLGEYQYTSVMDYGSRFNSDVHGLGKYDEAAILMGYGNLIEVWDDVDLDLDSDPMENADQDYWNLSSAIFLRTADHLVELMGGDIGNIKKRKTMDFDEWVAKYRQALIATAEDESAPPVQDDAVPYGFCEDLYAGPPGGYPQCQRWDFGSTMVEKARDVISRYRNYYFWNNFRRERFDDYRFYNSFVYRLYDRTFEYLTTIFKYFFFYRAIVGQALIDPTEAQGIEFGRDYARAAIEGINLLGEVLQTPTWGKFCLGTEETERYHECDAGEWCPASYFEDCEASGLDIMEIPFGVGRDPYFKFSDDLLFKFDVIGSIFEKLLGIMALTDTMSVFYGQDFVANFGTFDINPYRLFQQEMLDLFTGLITGENEYYSGVLVGGDPETGDYSQAYYRPRKLVDPGKRYPEGFLVEEDLEGTQLVDSADNFTVAFYASLFGMALMSSPFDGAKNFSDYTRIVLAGSGDDYITGIPPEELEMDGTPGGRICTFTDPDTLFTYKAIQTPDGRSIACLLMDKAQEILDGVEVDGELQGGWWDLKEAYESAKAAWERDPNDPDLYKAYADAKTRFDDVDVLLDRWVDRMTMLREIQAVFEPGH